MKRIINLTLLLILLPAITILVLSPIQNKKQETKYTLEKNTSVRVMRSETNTIEKIPLEQYLIGVLSGEMPISYNIEALKAQAVAARTYTLKKMETNKDNSYDVIDTTDDQVYLDDKYLKENWKEKYNEYIKKVKQAVDETSGEYLTYDGQIIKAFFFSTSSGTTENCKDVFGENLPYLISVSSTWDVNSPSYLDSKTLSLQEFYQTLGLEYQEELNINIERNETNSISNITVNNTTFKGTEFRQKLNLKSTNIEITQEGKEVTLISKGFGHGVGMSQYGAQQLAQQGYKYNEILKYYYTGIDFKKI